MIFILKLLLVLFFIFNMVKLIYDYMVKEDGVKYLNMILVVFSLLTLALLLN